MLFTSNSNTPLSTSQKVQKLVKSMDNQLTHEESVVLQFVQDYFASYDKNRHIMHSLFSEDGTFIMLGNRFLGHTAIQNAMLTMASTTHRVLSIDIQNVPVTLQNNAYLFQVLCAGDLTFENNQNIQGFNATFLIHYQQTNNLLIVSFNERCNWPRLS